MSEGLRKQFAKAKAEQRPALVTFMTAGYPRIEDTVNIMKAFQKGGVDVIELGMPFSDPIGDGPTIQMANIKSLDNGTTLAHVFEMVSSARSQGVTIPIVLMGYYNPILKYGESKFLAQCEKVGVNGFIIVDLPPAEGAGFREGCKKHNLSFVPLVTPATTDDRIQALSKIADGFIYVVSRMGTTGATGKLSEGIAELITRIRKNMCDSSIPLAVGFGISTREHFISAGSSSDGVVIGSKIVSLIEKAESSDIPEIVEKYVRSIVTGPETIKTPEPVTGCKYGSEKQSTESVDKRLSGFFGNFGGQYVPEALHTCIDELEKAFNDAVKDPEFWKEFRSMYSYMGRPSSLHKAERLTAEAGGATIWLKREDLNHTGSHKINNAIAQVILAKRLGKKYVIAETGAGQHGVATATACAKFGLKCRVFMGAEDVRRQALNVFRIKLLGADVVPITNGTQTLRDATSEAFRYWVSHLEDTHYCVGSAIGPHPYPTLVRTFQSVIGQEVKEEFKKLNDGKLPDAVVACVGGGSNSTGLFAPFENDLSVKMLGVEAGGSGIDSGYHSATLTAGIPGVFHGVKTYVLQDEEGQIHDTHSVSAGLDYPGVGPELASWKDNGRAEFVAATDAEALLGFKLLSQLEGIIPALESSHAIFGGMQLAKRLGKGKNIVINVSGRGDKDVQSVAEVLPKLGPEIGWDLRFEQT